MTQDAIRQKWFQPGQREVLKSALTGLFVVALGALVYLAYRSYALQERNNGEVTGDAAEPGAVRREITRAPAETSTPNTPAIAPEKSSGITVTSSGAAAAPGGLTPPPADTIAPNPPNGLAFGGSGHFQLYRQGDITWRLNTETGQACILFASDAEWHQPRVHRAACNHSRN